MRRCIVITGATGFIGSAVTAELLARGHHVTVLTRPGSDVSRLIKSSDCQVIRSEFLSGEAIRQTLGRTAPDTFIHCAWRGVGGAERNASWQITGNLRLTLDALELAKAVGCRHWLSLGSQAEYGNANRQIKEDSPLNPTTLYGRAKLLAGQAALAYCEAEGIRGAVLRVFSTYGPGDSPGWFVPYIIREFLAGRSPALTKCEQVWDYLYVTDAAKAIVSAVENQITGVFNLGSGRAQSLRTVVEMIRDELSTEIGAEYGAVPYRPDQVMHLEADISSLVEATGWNPLTPLNFGLRTTIAFEKEKFNVAPHVTTYNG